MFVGFLSVSSHTSEFCCGRPCGRLAEVVTDFVFHAVTDIITDIDNVEDKEEVYFKDTNDY